MILKDGKHIQGIFKYVPGVKYELGDFVIEDDCIYICKKSMLDDNELDTLPSANKAAFSPYPGSLIASLDEYEKYLEDPNGKEDKYISSNVLLGILQSMYFGFGDTGVINSYIATSGDQVNIDTRLQSLLGKANKVSDKPLDLLMMESSINNAYVQVSRDLLEIKDLLISGKNNCLLRQYTYLDLNDLGNGKKRIRVQELVDFENGIAWFRHATGTYGYKKLKNGLPSIFKGLTWNYSLIDDGNWKCTTVSPSLLRKMNEIINYYSREQQSLESTRDGFNFRNLILPENTTSECMLYLKKDENPLDDSRVITPLNNFKTESFLITINTKVLQIKNGIYKACSLTLDTRDTANGPGLDYYYLDDNTKLEVKYTNGTTPSIKLTILEMSGKVNENAAILSIYYRSNGD